MRIKARGRSDDFESAEELRTRDMRELGWGLGKAIGDADIHLSNENTLEEFSRSVHSLLKHLGGSP
jgi:dephospho-CoA kinase